MAERKTRGRHDFPKKVVDTTAKRAGYACSNPHCPQDATVGPSSNPDKSVSVGRGAHITAASPMGPRFDASLTPSQRKAASNCIWLCAKCADLVDKDEARHPVALLQKWKAIHEARIAARIGSQGPALPGSLAKLEGCDLFQLLRRQVGESPALEPLLACLEDIVSISTTIDDVEDDHTEALDRTLFATAQACHQILEDAGVKYNAVDAFLCVALIVAQSNAIRPAIPDATVGALLASADETDRTRTIALLQAAHRAEMGTELSLAPDPESPVIKMLQACPELPDGVFLNGLSCCVAPLSEVDALHDVSTEVTICGYPAHVLLVTACVRVALLMDWNSPRISPFMGYMSDPTVFFDGSYWRSLRNVSMNRLPAGNVRFDGESPSQDVERVLREWVRSLQDESDRAAATTACLQEGSRLSPRLVEYQVRPLLDDKGQPSYEFLEYRFRIDEQQVVDKLLGRRLYGRSEVAIRELFQNAIDATRARVGIECAMMPGWEDAEANIRRKRFASEYDSRKRHLPLRITLKEDRARNIRWLSITDSGLGMSRDVVEHYLLKIGVSRWRKDPRLSGLEVGTIGEFGIGFLSTFLISDQTVIETKSMLPRDEGLRLTIYSWSGYMATETASELPVGTTVRMQLKPNVTIASMEELIDLVSRWVPFCELPIGVRFQNEERSINPVSSQSKADGWLYAPLWGGEGRSLCAFGVRKNLEDTPRLSQDGLVVADMPPPTGERPGEKLVRLSAIRVDLRGDDRIRLDLSRNLSAGGADGVWRQLIPRIVSSMIKLGASPGVAEIAQQYVNAEFIMSKGETVSLYGHAHGLRSAAWRRVDFEWPDQLTFARLAAGRQVASSIIGQDAGRADIVILPDRLADHAFDANQFLPAGYHWHSGGTRHFTEPEEDAEAEESSVLAAINAAHVGEYWYHQLTRLISLDQEWQPSARLFAGLASKVMSAYASVKMVEDGTVVLHRAGKKQSGAVSIADLAFMRLGLGIIAVRSPCDGEWRIVLESEALSEFSLEEVRSLTPYRTLVFVLICLWPPTGAAWTGPWPKVNIARIGIEVANSIVAFEETREKADDEAEPEDDSAESPFDIYEDYWRKSEEEDSRRKSDAILRWRHTVNMPVVQKLREVLAPWEI